MPASGKSTLTKFVRLGLEQRPRLSSFPVFGVVDFFYNCRGSEAQKGHQFMLRSILYQILRTIPSNWLRFREVYSPYRIAPGVPSDLDFDTLKLLFTKLINRIHFRTVLYVIIDAIDESDQVRRQEILGLFNNLCCSPTKLIWKIFITSRPIPEVATSFRDCLTLRLENKTSSDIQRYVQFEIKRMNISGLGLEKVVDGLVERSRGAFLWVKLAIIELEEMASTGCTIGEIEKRLWSLPSELEDVYGRLLAKLVEQPTVSARLFHWVAYSLRPLTLTEIKVVMAVGSLGESFSESFSNTDLEENGAIRQGHVERQLKMLCGGLVEVENNTVRFIHLTARDYLMGLPESSQFHISQDSGDEYITSTCNRYLKYMEGAIGACKVPEDPDMCNKDHLYRVIDFFENLHLFSYAIYHFSARKALGGDNAQVFQTLSRAFRTAIRESNSEAIARLLRIVVGKQDTEKPILDVNVDCGPRTELLKVEDENHLHPIHVAAARGDRDVVALLIDWGAMTLNTTNKCGITPLHLASENGNEATVQLLLEKGARVDAQAKDTYASTPLDFAAKNGQEGMVRLLRDFQTRCRTSSW